jgi:nucleoside-diphosphate-sugar epimerase
VTALTRNAQKASAIEEETGARCVVGELASADWHGAISGPVDLVLNCVSSGAGGVENYRRSYVEGMRSIVAWLRLGRVGRPRFVYTSSTSVYPKETGPDVLSEDMPVVGDTPTGQILVEAENLARAEVASMCESWFVLRLAGIYGPGRHRLLDLARSGDWGLNVEMDRTINLVHRNDIVSAIFASFAAEMGKSGIYNVADGQPATRREILTWLATQIGKSASSHGSAADAQMKRRVVDATRLREALGWRPAYPDYRTGYAAILREGH